MKVIRSACVALTAVLLVFAPGLANAADSKHFDPAGDVQYWINTDPSNIPPPIAAPGRNLGDITGVRITNGTTRVRVVVHFRSLRRLDQFHGHVFRFVAGTFERKAQIVAGPETPRGWAGQSEMFTRRGTPVACRGMKHLLDYHNRRLIFSVPRSCLHNPGSVRVGAGTAVLANHRTYFDDAFRRGGTMGVEAMRPTLGPSVAR